MMSDGADRNACTLPIEPQTARFETPLCGASTTPPQDLAAARATRPSSAALVLPDRGLFRQQMEQRLAQGAVTPLALLYVEVEADPAGAPDGALERILALRVARALRGDDVVGRMASCQYACLLTGVPGRHALDHVAERLRAALEAPLRLGSGSARVRAHIGIAVCPRDGVTPGVLLKHADEATFRARAHGFGHTFFDPRLDP